MTGSAQSLSEGARPSHVCPPDCPHKDEGTGYCADHPQMESSRARGMAYLNFGAWFVGIGVVVLIGILSFILTRVDTVEGKVDKHVTGSYEKLDQIHHAVMTIEFNMRRDFQERDMGFTELSYKEEY